MTNDTHNEQSSITSQPLRVLHVVEAFGGGVFEVVRTLTRYQVDRHPVAIAYGTRPETPTEVCHYLDPRVELFPLPWERRTSRAQLKAAHALSRIVPTWSPSVIHLHSSFAGVVGTFAIKAGPPTLYSPHAYSFQMNQNRARRAFFLMLERYVARHVGAVGAVSAHEADLARQHALARRVFTVSNGIPELDACRTRRPDIHKPPLTVTSMGRTDPQRQPRAAARILRAVADEADVRWIGGAAPGSHGSAVPGVRMTGWLERDVALRLLADADIYLHWTAWDGQALSIMEAMARDVIVIASDIPPNRDIVGGKQVCASESAAIDLIRRLLQTPGLRAEYRARQRALRGRFGAQRMASNWDTVYREMANGARAQRTAPSPALTAAR